MGNNNLIPYEDNNIFAKIISFFKKLFVRNSSKGHVIESVNEDSSIAREEDKNRKDTVRENIIVQEENKKDININLLIKYRNGDIDEEEMTDEEFEIICNTYQEQILQLRKSNQIRKEKLLMYRQKMQISG